MNAMVVRADARALPLRDESVDCIVTSPPYWGLRDHGVDGQLGLEPTPEEYVADLMVVFGECWRVLKANGTAWLNLGDSYSGSGKGGNPDGGKQATNKGSQSIGTLYGKTGETAKRAAVTNVPRRFTSELGFAAKQLIGIPWRVAFALQAAGWWLRSDIVWAKPNPMPESVTDRPTRSHEYVFLLTKSGRYWYDAEAIAEPAGPFHAGGRNNALDVPRTPDPRKKQDALGKNTCTGFNDRWAESPSETRNARSVWTIATQPYSGAHFATFPEELARRCIVAGCPAGGIVLDPFAGSGTVGKVAIENGRNALLCDLAYQDLAAQRISWVQQPLMVNA